MLLKLDTTKITPYKAGLSDKKACNKQINEGVSLLRKIKKAYYSNLNVKNSRQCRVLENSKKYLL